MVRVSVVSKDIAQETRKPKAPGVRRQRMDEFDEYARYLNWQIGDGAELPTGAAIYDLDPEDGSPQKFVLSLRAAFARAGVKACVRKCRGRSEVRAWLSADGEAPRSPARGRHSGPAQQHELAAVGM